MKLCHLPSRTLLFLAALFFAAAAALAFSGKEEVDDGFTVVFTGADAGVLEPCGCTDGQLGGIVRRDTLIDSEDRPRLILSTGGIAGGTSQLQRIRFEIILLCQIEMGYNAMGLGPEELRLGMDTIREAAEEFEELPFLLTNVTFPGEVDPPFLPYLKEEIGNYTVRILSIIPESFRAKLPEEARFIPPDEAIQKVMEESPEADLTVVLLRGDRQEAKEIDACLSGPRLLCYSAPHSEYQIYEFGKKTGLIRYLSPGGRGRYLVSCRMKSGEDGALSPSPPVVWPLTDQIPESDDIRTYLAWYKSMVIEDEVLATMVGIKPPPRGAPYVGNNACILCHEKAYATWKESTHAHAYLTLVTEDREFDPECLSCHTTGFGFKTGFTDVLKEDPRLVDVGCESCHGPCWEHVSTAGEAPTPQKVDCTTCHDLDHSSSFEREVYWKKIPCLPDDPPPYLEKGTNVKK